MQDDRRLITGQTVIKGSVEELNMVLSTLYGNDVFELYEATTKEITFIYPDKIKKEEVSVGKQPTITSIYFKSISLEIDKVTETKVRLNYKFKMKKTSGTPLERLGYRALAAAIFTLLFHLVFTFMAAVPTNVPFLILLFTVCLLFSIWPQSWSPRKQVSIFERDFLEPIRRLMEVAAQER